MWHALRRYAPRVAGLPARATLVRSHARTERWVQWSRSASVPCALPHGSRAPCRANSLMVLHRSSPLATAVEQDAAPAPTPTQQISQNDSPEAVISPRPRLERIANNRQKRKLVATASRALEQIQHASPHTMRSETETGALLHVLYKGLVAASHAHDLPLAIKLVQSAVAHDLTPQLHHFEALAMTLAHHGDIDAIVDIIASFEPSPRLLTSQVIATASQDLAQGPDGMANTDGVDRPSATLAALDSVALVQSIESKWGHVLHTAAFAHVFQALHRAQRLLTPCNPLQLDLLEQNVAQLRDLLLQRKGTRHESEALVEQRAINTAACELSLFPSQQSFVVDLCQSDQITLRTLKRVIATLVPTSPDIALDLLQHRVRPEHQGHEFEIIKLYFKARLALGWTIPEVLQDTHNHEHEFGSSLHHRQVALVSVLASCPTTLEAADKLYTRIHREDRTHNGLIARLVAAHLQADNLERALELLQTLDPQFGVVGAYLPLLEYFAAQGDVASLTHFSDELEQITDGKVPTRTFVLAVQAHALAGDVQGTAAALQSMLNRGSDLYAPLIKYVQHHVPEALELIE
eukprot:m.361642 g.361642  ORF g.361642 m.361642 type:complete len:578 (+) comp19746_c0_seq1:76-1809(+)